MTYNPSIPQPTNLISNSQSQLLANFGQLNTQFGVDHDKFNTGSGNGTGWHKQVTFIAPLSMDPTPASGQGIAYTKTVSGAEQLFYINSEGATQQISGFPVVGAWVVFSGLSPSISASYNVSTVTYNAGTNKYTITFLTNFASANYCVSYTPVSASGGNLGLRSVTPAIGSFIFSNGTNNVGPFYLIFYGPLA